VSLHIRYRLQQFARALTGHVSPAERALVTEYLLPGELRLFERMPRFDQRHCLDVFHTLVHGGYTDPLLLRAALIHDCGKVDDHGHAIPLLYYGLFVITERVAPGVYTWAAQSGRGLLWPFAIHATHEERSARLAEQAGSPPQLVAILRDYAGSCVTPAAQALRRADDRH
jgi:hypothetical protein